jgi:ethanolaminephosphotransferase
MIESSLQRKENGRDANLHGTEEADAASQLRSFFFLNKDAQQHLIDFQYSGEDRSILYKHVLSPVANFCVHRLTPRWLAPNTITLIGLLWMATSYFIFAYYAPNLDVDKNVELPSWIFFFNGLAMLVYQTLDNMDGKQARRTRSSSPLGLLFDHGCDAINMVFGAANWMVFMGLDPRKDSLMCWAILVLNYNLFYCGTWEEYYTGSLIMPIFNGPSEGVFGGAVMSIVTGLLGVKFWHSHSWWLSFVEPVVKVVPVSLRPNSLPASGFRNADLLVLFSCIGFIQETAIKIVTVPSKYGWYTLLRLVPGFTLVICSLLMDGEVWWSMPRTSMHLCAALFVEMITALMVAHMTHQPYQYLRWPLFPLVVATLLNLIGLLKSGPVMRDFLLIYTTVIITFLVCKFTVLIYECSTLLNIWCFDITTPRRQSSANIGASSKKGGDKKDQ